VIKKGEMILRKGEVISNDQMLKLEKLGLVKTDFDYRMFVKDFPLIMLFFLLFHMFCYRFYNTMFSQYRIYLFILLLFAFVLSFESFIDDTRFLLIPFITALMIIVSLWGRRFMIFSSLILGLLLSTKVGNDYSFLISLIVSAFVLSFSFNSKGTRNALFVSSLITGTSVAASMWIISYSSELVLDYVYLFKTSLYSVLFCFGAAILSVGSLYLIERLLGLVSHARLYELTDQNHPLLRELQKNAPGTYTHSIMVANLAEMAADEIGANGVLVRAAAFFHDVGKLKNPKFFIENSSPEDNAHNNLEPLESAKIILDHPHESVRLCREHKLPDVVNEVIASHHGDSLVRVFYNKAQEMGLNPVEKDYRYTTPSPSSKEQGILMLADSVEAFSRTLYGKSKDDVYLSLRDMIFEKIKRGELRHCELDFSEVEIIIEVFSSYLSTVPHLRLSYPKG
jgi:putative nucleotidyltransferase with HDIG domain